MRAFRAEQQRTGTGPVGRLVDIGGHRLHVLVQGEPTDRPVVVLESGLATPVQAWTHVQGDLAADTVVVSYERAGNGWSQPGPRPRSVDRLAGELHALLGALAVAGPVVLVGHSFGGLVAYRYAETYPGDVAGVVFVDALHPEELRRSANQRRGMAWLEQSLQISAAKAALGLARRQVRGQFVSLPEDVAAQARARMHRSGLWRTATAELVHWKNSDPRASVRGSFPDGVPVAVVVSGDSLRNDVAHRRLQEDLVSLSPRAFLEVVPDASHFGLVLERQPAAEIVAAVRRVLAASPTSSGR